MTSIVDLPVVVEAVPNFSEGRRPAVIAELAQAIQVPGVHLLHQTSDWDHNRCVLTVAGPPAAVLEGLFQAIGVAAARIDLFTQRGAHPRLGAADVVPLVPIRGITLEECAELARQLGQRIGTGLHLPVYLYEAAATRPERRFLGNVRRGEFERLITEITRPERQPDFGPLQVGPAGAVIVGARPFLIAFNIFLKSADLRIAKAIAATIRERNGGLPAVRALGLLVDGRAQVSMNLVDFNQTPLPMVMETVTRLAAEHGVEIDRSELIGLAPQAALLQVAAHYLKLPDLAPARVLEEALRTAGL
jgi:glutamate formiminotransferase